MSTGFQHYINDLENVDSILVFDRINILLTAANLKSTSFFDLMIISTEEQDAKQNTVSNLEYVLQGMGLKFFKRTEVLDSPNYGKVECIRYFISRDDTLLSKLVKLITVPYQNDYEIGVLLGYPATAAYAYANNLPLKSNIPTEVDTVDADNMRLLSFRLSEKHWAEEVKLVTTYGNYLKRASPNLYAAAVKFSE